MRVLGKRFTRKMLIMLMCTSMLNYYNICIYFFIAVATVISVLLSLLFFTSENAQ